MKEEVGNFINHQCLFVRQKKPQIQGKAPLLPVTSSVPLKIVGIDFLYPEKSSGGFEYILLITNYFTRYTQAYPSGNKTAKTDATCPYDNFVLHFGISSQLLHDQGALFKYLANLLGNLRTTPYHPETNGLTGWINQTVQAMLRSHQEKYKTSWKDDVNKVIHPYNCSKYSSLGFLPYYLMFGCKLRLPVDIILQTEVDTPHSTHKQ